MRSISAAANRMERDSERRYKAALKDAIAQDAATDVESWQQYKNELVSIHTDLTEKIEWQHLLKKPVPKPPIKKSEYEAKAGTLLSAYKPKFWDFLRGGSEKRHEALIEAYDMAKLKDTEVYEAQLEKYVITVDDIENDRSLAKKLYDGDTVALKEVLSEMQTLSETAILGSSLEFMIEDGFIHARPQVHSDDIVPNFRRKQLASGKLSETKMPIGEFNELYQDYVASVALKVAGDLFQMLPIDEVIITCESNLLNKVTGYKKPTAILSVLFVRETMSQLKLDTVDPSDSMKNFNHSMKFSRTKGFASIEPLQHRKVKSN